VEIEGYEYNIQYRWTKPETIERLGDGWNYIYTNRFSQDAWYPKRSSVNNALAQMTASRYGYRRDADREYRIIRRPYGAVEVVDES
jgi:hypothetical protein